MIRVRYQGPNELSPGLHATAERDGSRTTVYLLDGMTVTQRQSALRRLRLTARMGHCPRLPAAQLAFALFADRIRTGIGRAGAVLRLHPAGSTVPIMVLSGGAIAFLLFSTVSIHVLRPQPADQSALGRSPVVSASPVATGFGWQGQGGPGGAGNPGDPGGIGARAAPGGLGSGSDPRQLTQPNSGSGGTTPALAAGGGGAGTGAGSGGTGSASGSASGSGSGSASGTTSNGGKSSGGTTLSGGSNPSQVTSKHSAPAPSAPAPAPARTAPATTPTQSGSSSGSSSGAQSNGVCVNVGPLGVCLNI